MLLESGDKLFVVHRRLFERDVSRFFAGTVEAYDSGVAKITGYTFVRNSVSGAVSRKDDIRTKLFSLASGTLMFYVLPRELEVASLRLVSEEPKLALVAGQSFRLDLSEWSVRST